MADSFNHFDAIAEALVEGCKEAIKKTAQQGQENVQKEIKANGQIATGFMHDSVYNVTSENTTYKGGTKALPEVDKPSTSMEAYVAVAANYAMPQNYGSRYLPARPFWEPGMRKTQDDFDKNIADIASKLEDAAR